MAVTRAVEVNDLTSHELAEIFTEMGSDDQAKFFARIWEISQSWLGAGWCMQSFGIAEQSERFPGCRDAVKTLAAHFEEE